MADALCNGLAACSLQLEFANMPLGTAVFPGPCQIHTYKFPKRFFNGGSDPFLCSSLPWLATTAPDGSPVVRGAHGDVSGGGQAHALHLCWILGQGGRDQDLDSPWALRLGGVGSLLVSRGSDDMWQPILIGLSEQPICLINHLQVMELRADNGCRKVEEAVGLATSYLTRHELPNWGISVD